MRLEDFSLLKMELGLVHATNNDQRISEPMNPQLSVLSAAKEMGEHTR